MTPKHDTTTVARALRAIRTTLPKAEAEEVEEQFKAIFRDASPARQAILAWFVIEACRSGHVPVLR